MTKDFDRYCAAPFVHVRSVQGTDKWTPCCAFNPGYQDFKVPLDYENPIMHPHFERLRQRMLNNETIAQCHLCDSAAADGLATTRNGFNDTYGYRTDVNLLYLEVNFGTLCNLRCRMCNSGSSSRWVADEMKLGIRPILGSLLRRDVSDLRVPFDNLTKLRITGGEPLMEQQKIIGMLNEIADAQGDLSKLTFAMVSNGTMDIDDKLLELMLMCDKVFLQTSVDGLGKVNDFQRTGSSFSEIEPRLRRYDSMVDDDWTHSIALSLGIFNVGGYIPFVDWVNQELPNTWMDVQPIYDPEWQSIHNLPIDLKNELSAELLAWVPKKDDFYEFGTKVASMLKTPAVLQPQDIAMRITEMDALTNEDFSEIDPRVYGAIFSS